MNTRRIKAQSAMEYLMTYGWAILIIAVVLGALFSLGIFSSAGLLGNSCVAGPGYLCSSMTLGLNGNISFSFGQSTGTTFYNVGMGCAALSTASGLPSTTNAATNGIVYLTSTGATTTNSASLPFNGVLTLVSGQTVSVSGLKCYNSVSATMNSGNSPLGTVFSGSLWVNYTTGSSSVPTAPGTGANPLLTAKFATVTAKAA